MFRSWAHKNSSSEQKYAFQYRPVTVSKFYNKFKVSHLVNIPATDGERGARRNWSQASEKGDGSGDTYASRSAGADESAADKPVGTYARET